MRARSCGRASRAARSPNRNTSRPDACSASSEGDDTMASKRTGLIAGGILALLVGTAGLAAAQDPTPAGRPGMNGANGMMNGANGMMNGANGMGTMDADHLALMTAMHESTAAGGACDPALMQQMHQQVQPSR